MNSRVISKWFYFVMFTLITLFTVLLLIEPTGNQLYVFFIKTKDFLADFFNVQIYIADWDPYHNTVNGLGEKCYLPLTYLFLELFNGFYDYSGASLADCYASTEALLSGMMFMAFSLFLFYHSLSCLKNVPKEFKFVLFFSSVILFSLERGNVMILCVSFICYFLAYKDSQNKWLRSFALVCLCVASVMKIYPALLGVFLLKERRFKEIAACVVFSLLLAFIPFFFFQGQLDNVVQLLNNIASNSNVYSPYKMYPRFGISPLIAWTIFELHFDGTRLSEYLLLLSKGITILLCLVSVVLFFYEKIGWKRLALITLPIMLFPTNSAFYCGLYFIPVILLFINDNQGRKVDFVFMMLICCFLNPLQLVINNFSVTEALSNVSAIVIWLLLLSEGLISLKNKRKELTQ